MVTASVPINTTAVAIARPMQPTIIPRITTRPSLLSNPNDIRVIPIAGTILPKGIGNNIEIENIKEKRPINFSPLADTRNKKRGVRIFSVFFQIW